MYIFKCGGHGESCESACCSAAECMRGGNFRLCTGCGDDVCGHCTLNGMVCEACSRTWCGTYADNNQRKKAGGVESGACSRCARAGRGPCNQCLDRLLGEGATLATAAAAHSLECVECTAIGRERLRLVAQLCVQRGLPPGSAEDIGELVGFSGGY